MAEDEQISQLKAQVAQYDLYLGSSSNLPQNIRDADRETQRQFIDRIQASRASVLGSISQLEKGQISGTTDQLIGQANEAGRSASYYGSLSRSQSASESNFSTLLDKYNSGKATTEDIQNLSQSGFLNQEQRVQLQASTQQTSRQSQPTQTEEILGMSLLPQYRNKSVQEIISNQSLLPNFQQTTQTERAGNISIYEFPKEYATKIIAGENPQRQMTEIIGYETSFNRSVPAYLPQRQPSVEDALGKIGITKGDAKGTLNYEIRNDVIRGLSEVASIGAKSLGKLNDTPLFKSFDVGFEFLRPSNKLKFMRGPVIAGKIALSETNPVTGTLVPIYFISKTVQSFLNSPLGFIQGTEKYIKEDTSEFIGGLLGGSAYSPLKDVVGYIFYERFPRLSPEYRELSLKLSGEDKIRFEAGIDLIQLNRKVNTYQFLKGLKNVEPENIKLLKPNEYPAIAELMQSSDIRKTIGSSSLQPFGIELPKGFESQDVDVIVKRKFYPTLTNLEIDLNTQSISALRNQALKGDVSGFLKNIEPFKDFNPINLEEQIIKRKAIESGAVLSGTNALNLFLEKPLKTTDYDFIAPNPKEFTKGIFEELNKQFPNKYEYSELIKPDFELYGIKEKGALKNKIEATQKQYSADYYTTTSGLRIKPLDVQFLDKVEAITNPLKKARYAKDFAKIKVLEAENLLQPKNKLVGRLYTGTKQIAGKYFDLFEKSGSENIKLGQSEVGFNIVREGEHYVQFLNPNMNKFSFARGGLKTSIGEKLANPKESMARQIFASSDRGLGYEDIKNKDFQRTLKEAEFFKEKLAERTKEKVLFPELAKRDVLKYEKLSETYKEKKISQKEVPSFFKSLTPIINIKLLKDEFGKKGNLGGSDVLTSEMNFGYPIDLENLNYKDVLRRGLTNEAYYKGIKQDTFSLNYNFKEYKNSYPNYKSSTYPNDYTSKSEYNYPKYNLDYNTYNPYNSPKSNYVPYQPPYNPKTEYNTYKESTLYYPKKTTTTYPIFTKEPPPKTKDFPMFFDLDERKPRRAFRVQVKRRGKFFNVGQPLPLGQAKRLGSSVVETSLARTFRLVPEGLTEQQDNPFFVNQEVFRESRISNREEMFTPLTFIERKGQTLKNVFEVNEIQYERSISDSLFSIPKSKKKKKSILKRIGNNIINFGGI